MIAPPVGPGLCVSAEMAKASVTNVIRAAFPWVAIVFGLLMVVTFVPIVSTWPRHADEGPS